MLYLNKCPKFAVEVFKHIVPFIGPLDSSMTPAHTYVISNAHVALLSSADADVLFTLSINDIEDLGRNWCRANRFKYYVVFRRFFDVNYVNQAVTMCDLERENLLAQLAVKLFKLDDDLASVDLHRSFGFKPAFEA